MDEEDRRMFYALDYLISKNIKQIEEAIEEFTIFMNEKEEIQKK